MRRNEINGFSICFCIIFATGIGLIVSGLSSFSSTINQRNLNEMNQPYNIQDLEAQAKNAPTNKHPGGSPIPDPTTILWQPTMELRVFVKKNSKHTIQQKWIFETRDGDCSEWRDLPVVKESK